MGQFVTKVIFKVSYEISMTDKIYKMRAGTTDNKNDYHEQSIEVGLIDSDVSYESSIPFDSKETVWKSPSIPCKNNNDYEFLIAWYRVSMILMNCNATKTSETTLLYLLNN